MEQYCVAIRALVNVLPDNEKLLLNLKDCAEVALKKETKLDAWLYSMLSVTVITLVAGIGFFVLPYFERRESIKTMFRVLFLGLGVGALLGDAVLHLLPEAYGFFEVGNHPISVFKRNEVWVSFCLILGVILFCLVDQLMSMFMENHVHEEKTEVVTNEEFSHRKILPLGWMILFGDAVHNFMDGIVIGITFGEDNKKGFATAFAVFLHEIPHELADFAALLIAKIPPGRAAIYNMASNLTSYLGAAIGLIFHQSMDDQKQKLALSFTAGGFIYIALADLCPALCSLQNNQKKKSWSLFVAKICSIVLGLACMLLVLVFDEFNK